MNAAQERPEFPVERLVADRASDARLRKVLKTHPTVRTGDVRRVVGRLALLRIAAKNALEEIVHRDVLLLRTENRFPVTCRTVHTYILFTPSARADLHDVHDRLVASAFFTKHSGNPFPLAPG